MKKLYNWFVYSSANPEKVSLTIKSTGALVISALLTLSGLANIQLESVELTNLLDMIVTGVSSALTFIGSIGAICGLARKIYLSFKK